MKEAVIQGPKMEGIVRARSGAPLLASSHQINHNLSALCIQCNEGTMGECHRLDSIPNFVMFSSIALSFAGLSSVVMNFLVHLLASSRIAMQT
jgi:hypothetical protein